ncbi:hypothetical protein [uncultured Ruegeria sp.]|uniref:hypothetical protein n=1 Tax=uncultured Ruegeria sp. TaxID=259304 RepID=UPI00262C78E8|nr:hypothetical protein [uncultured Ruegeria sp.]
MLTEKTNAKALLLIGGYPTACITSVVEPLRAVDRFAGPKAFSWSMVAEDGGKVRSCANVRFEAERDLPNCQSLDMLFHPTPQFQREIKERFFFVVQIVRADDYGAASNIAVTDLTLFVHRDTLVVVNLGNIMGRGRTIDRLHL